MKKRRGGVNESSQATDRDAELEAAANLGGGQSDLEVQKSARPRAIAQLAAGTPPAARPLVLAMTGASGAPYAVRLLQVLSQSGREVHLVLSQAGAQVLGEEMDIRVEPDHFDLELFLEAILGPATRARPLPSTWLHYHHTMDWSAGIASGSFLTDGMIVCPCSMSTLAAIAGGLSTNLIQRAADVHLKERRKLILVPRETPLNLIHLGNMSRCVEAGAIVLPAMPGWYHRPQSLDDIINFVVGRICDHVGVVHRLFQRWGDAEKSYRRGAKAAEQEGFGRVHPER